MDVSGLKCVSSLAVLNVDEDSGYVFLGSDFGL